MMKIFLVILIAVICGFWNPFVHSEIVINDDFSADDQTQYSGLQLIATMPIAKSDHTATLVEENLFGDNKGPRIFIIGGCNGTQSCAPWGNNQYNCTCTQITNSCEVYFPSSNSWSTCPPAPTNRYRHNAAFINGEIWVAGGRTLPTDEIIKSIDIFSPTLNSWRTLNSIYEWKELPSDGASFAVGSKLYLIGGYNQTYASTSTLASFDTVTNIWNHSLPSMKYDRGDITVEKVSGHKFYVIGGWHSADYFCSPLKYVEIYDAAENKWTEGTPMIYGRGKPAVGQTGEFIFAIAGETRAPNTKCSLSDPVPIVSRYGMVKDIWKVESNISLDLFRYVGVSYNTSDNLNSGSVLLFGGQKNFNYSTNTFSLSNIVLKYNPIENIDDSNNKKETLSAGAKAGIAIAVIVIVCMIVGFFIWYFKFKDKSPLRNKEETFTTPLDADAVAISLRNSSGVQKL